MNTIRFGTDGWLVVIADDFTLENVSQVAVAIARYVVRAEKSDHGVACDGIRGCHASGTENMLRVYSETTRAENTERLLNEVSALVQAL